MSAPVLVCFAVPQEARPFQKMARARNDVHVLLTGIGERNAEHSVREALKAIGPRRVFSCGFAGALRPDLKIGDLVFAAEALTPAMTNHFRSLGARPVSFICSERVAITAEEKAALRSTTNADAVEMESHIIADVCARAGIECMTLRTVSDTAQENLPLDFNTLMTEEKKLSIAKLAWAVLKAPQKIPALIRLGRNSAFAAARLAKALAEII